MKFINFKKDYLLFLATNRLFFKNKNFLKYFGFIFGLYLIGYFKIIFNDVFYLDDWYRMQDYEPLFILGGRFFSEFLSHIFHMDYPYLNYNSPLNQLIAIAFLSLASMALVKIVNKKITYFGLIASLCVGLSPFYLDCLSYKYDSPYMAFATLCAILPFLFIKRLSLFFITSVIFLLCMWNLYQANNGIYIVLSMFITLNLILENKDKKQIYKFIFISALAFCISVLIYKFGFMPFKPEDRFNKAQTQIISSYMHLKTNFYGITKMLDLFLNHSIIKIIFFTICFLFLIIKFYEKKIKSSIFAIFFIITFLYIGFFATYGLYYILHLETHLYRYYISIGAFIAILSLSVIDIKFKAISFITKIVIIIFSYNLFLTSFISANTIKFQNDYLNFRHYLVHSFLQNNEKYKDYTLCIQRMDKIGTIDPIARNINFLPLLRLNLTLLPSYSAATNQYINPIPYTYIDYDICSKQQLQETIETKYNTFKIYNNSIEVFFKPASPFINHGSFIKTLFEWAPLIINRKLNNDINLTIYAEKIFEGYYNMAFEFDKDISKNSDTKIDFILHIKNSDKVLRLQKNTKDFKKYNGKYYYTAAFGNLPPSNIAYFEIVTYNENTNKSANFIIKWRPELEK